MPLSKQDLASIAKELASAKAESDATKSGLQDIDTQVSEKKAQGDRVYILYNRAQNEAVTPYETEHRWLNGVTHTTITQANINDAAIRATGNLYYPTGWFKGNAKIADNSNGNPTSVSANSEYACVNNSLENSGLIATISLLINGQSSFVSSDTLNASYSPGNATIDVTNGGQTNGQLLYISGSGTSALVRITSVAGTQLGISEIVAPANTISSGGQVIQNIPGFSNAVRQSMVSPSYQRILNALTSNINSTAALWNTALTNQLAQLSINLDQPAQVSTAKLNVQAALSAYATWNAFPASGLTGRFTDSSIAILTSAYTARASQITARLSQILTNLGSVSQNANGDYSGTGQYLQRFKCLNFLINSANGPLHQAYVLGQTKSAQTGKISTNADKLQTYSNVVRYASVVSRPEVQNTVKLDNTSQFSALDSVLMTGDNLPALELQITAITGTTVTFDKNIPAEFTKDSKSGIIKSV